MVKVARTAAQSGHLLRGRLAPPLAISPLDSFVLISFVVLALARVPLPVTLAKVKWTNVPPLIR
jgi:hypothetical protein